MMNKDNPLKSLSIDKMLFGSKALMTIVTMLTDNKTLTVSKALTNLLLWSMARVQTSSKPQQFNQKARMCLKRTGSPSIWALYKMSIRTGSTAMCSIILNKLKCSLNKSGSQIKKLSWRHTLQVTSLTLNIKSTSSLITLSSLHNQQTQTLHRISKFLLLVSKSFLKTNKVKLNKSSLKMMIKLITKLTRRDNSKCKANKNLQTPRTQRRLTRINIKRVIR